MADVSPTLPGGMRPLADFAFAIQKSEEILRRELELDGVPAIVVNLGKRKVYFYTEAAFDAWLRSRSHGLEAQARWLAQQQEKEARAKLAAAGVSPQTIETVIAASRAAKRKGVA